MLDFCLSMEAEPIIYTYNSCLQVLRQLESYCSKSLDMIYPPGLPSEFCKLKLTPQRVPVKAIPSDDDLGDFDRKLRLMSPEHRVLVCYNPDNSGIPGIHFIPKIDPNPSPCDCIHCYLRNAFPRNDVRKVFATHVPSVSNRIPKSFTLTMEEYQKIRNDSYRLSLVLLNRIGNSWAICGDRPRIWLNRVDINYIQVWIVFCWIWFCIIVMMLPRSFSPFLYYLYVFVSLLIFVLSLPLGILISST